MSENAGVAVAVCLLALPLVWPALQLLGLVWRLAFPNVCRRCRGTSVTVRETDCGTWWVHSCRSCGHKRREYAVVEFY